MSTNQRIIFIAGSGRSGSTLLEQLVAERVGGLAVGEARFFFGYYARGDIPCGCGAPLPGCEFWGPIGKKLQRSLDFAGVESDRRRYARLRSLLNPVARRRLLGPKSRLLSAYRSLYTVIADHSEGRVIIDSSKIPSHLAVLRQLCSDQLACLHLVRDPRAVAWAFSRRVKKDPASPQRGGLMLRRTVPVALAAWALENSWILRITGNIDQTTILRYEDLVRQPERTIDRVEEVAAGALSGGDQSEPMMLHSVGGNPVRFNTGERVIREDLEWLESSGRLYRILAGLPVYPLLRVFGYSVRTGP